MPPNTIEMPVVPETFITEIKTIDNSMTKVPVKQEENAFSIFQSTLVLFANILIGIVLGVNLAFAFRNGLPLGATPLHIVLCVIGYQLLMAQAILSLTSSQAWHSKLTLTQKRRAHWILQLAGSILAITGSFIKILDKNVHWNTLHGQFGLVALVFTSVSLVNGLTSLYAFELRRILPASISKLTHICFGTVAFGASTICLCFGVDKSMFRNWATSSMADTFIAFIAIYTIITIVNPIITFYGKSKSVISRR